MEIPCPLPLRSRFAAETRPTLEQGPSAPTNGTTSHDHKCKHDHANTTIANDNDNQTCPDMGKCTGETNNYNNNGDDESAMSNFGQNWQCLGHMLQTSANIETACGRVGP